MLVRYSLLYGDHVVFFVDIVVAMRDGKKYFGTNFGGIISKTARRLPNLNIIMTFWVWGKHRKHFVAERM